MITLYEYLAYNVPNECLNLLQGYDVVPAQNEQELVNSLKQYVNVYGYEALEKLAEIHPDKDLIAELANIATPYKGEKESEFLNATGAIDRITNIESSMMSNNNTDNNTPDIISKTDVLLGIGVALLTATLFKNE